MCGSPALETEPASARDADGMTPLHYAAWYGHPLCVLALIEAGAEINAFDSDGATALHAGGSG
jgi:ankyrin repeat protein